MIPNTPVMGAYLDLSHLIAIELVAQQEREGKGSWDFEIKFEDYVSTANQRKINHILGMNIHELQVLG